MLHKFYKSLIYLDIHLQELKFTANIYLFQLHNRNNRERCEMCSKLARKAAQRRQ